jgi:hypothetical protein
MHDIDDTRIPTWYRLARAGRVRAMEAQNSPSPSPAGRTQISIEIGKQKKARKKEKKDVTYYVRS